MSTAPHLWRLILAARRAGARLVVVDPFRSRTARVADEHVRPLPGHRRRARARDDARDRRRRPARRGLVPGARDRLRRAARAARRRTRSSAAPSCAACRPRRSRASGASSRRPSRRCCGSASARSATWAPRSPTARSPACRRWRAPGGTRAAACSYIPTATSRTRSTAGRAAPARPPARAGARINMSQLGAALTDPALDPPVTALVCWNANPAAIAPDQDRVLDGLRREDLFTVVLEQFMTDTARHADVVLPATTQLEHLDARLLLGPPLRDLQRAGDRAARAGQAQHARSSACWPRAWASTIRASARATRSCWPRRSPTPRPASRCATCASAAGRRSTSGRDAAPHAEGGFGTPDGKLALRADRLAARGIDPLPFYDPPAEVADRGARAPLPARPLTPKTHLFLNSTFAEPAPPARRPAGAVRRHPSRRRRRRAAIDDGALVRVWNDRGAFEARARVSDDTRPDVLVAPMGWWNRDYPRRPVARRPPPRRRLTTLGEAPIFNDNRVEAAPL